MHVRWRVGIVSLAAAAMQVIGLTSKLTYISGYLFSRTFSSTSLDNRNQKCPSHYELHLAEWHWNI